MASWAAIRQAEARLAWHLTRYHYRRSRWEAWKKTGDRAHEWLRIHRQRREAKAAAINEQQILKARAEIRKWNALMAPELSEVERYRSWLARNKPKPSDPYAAKRAELAREYPQTHAGIIAVVAQVLVHFPALYVTSTISGNHAEQSYHYLGRAYDIGGTSRDYEHEAAVWVAQHLTSQLTEGIHNSGLSVKYGVTVGSWFWGPVTWQAHRDHLHIAV